jgi:hypothetical protein
MERGQEDEREGGRMGTQEGGDGKEGVNDKGQEEREEREKLSGK